MKTRFFLFASGPGQEGIQRVRKYIPQAKTVVIPGVGHVLNYEAGKQVEQLVSEFFGTGLISP